MYVANERSDESRKEGGRGSSLQGRFVGVGGAGCDTDGAGDEDEEEEEEKQEGGVWAK